MLNWLRVLWWMIALACWDQALFAQSGGGTAQPRYQQQPAGSGSAASGSAPGRGSGSVGSNNSEIGSAMRSDVPVAMRGFCPVCLVQMRKWVPGEPRFAAIHDGKQYRFPDARRLQMFRANPTRYLPALGGDCVVHYVKTGQRVPGSLTHGAVHGGRIYFLASEEHRQQFLAAPERYRDADLAMGGDCVVCRVNMNRQMPGSPQLTSIHGGIRYRFAGLEQQRMFAAEPGRYVPAALAVKHKQGSATRNGSGGDGSAPRPKGSGSKAVGSGSASR